MKCSLGCCYERHSPWTTGKKKVGLWILGSFISRIWHAGCSEYKGWGIWPLWLLPEDLARYNLDTCPTVEAETQDPKVSYIWHTLAGTAALKATEMQSAGLIVSPSNYLLKPSHPQHLKCYWAATSTGWLTNAKWEAALKELIPNLSVSACLRAVVFKILLILPFAFLCIDSKT